MPRPLIFITVEGAIFIAVDAGAHPGARRVAGVGQLAAFPCQAIAGIRIPHFQADEVLEATLLAVERAGTHPR